MKFKILIVLMACVFCGCFNFNNSSVSAEGSTHNLCEDGVTVTWSGTWKTAGTEGTDNPGTNLIDGDYTNKWGSNDIRVTGEEWVQISFNKAVNIGGFYIVQEPSGMYTNIAQYKIQIQNQSDTWVDAYTSGVFDSFWSEDSNSFATPIKATAFRFICTSDQALPGPGSPEGECAIELSEIEIYEGSAVASTTNAGTSATMATGATSATTTNTSTANASATQSKVSPTTANGVKKASSTPSVDDKSAKNSAFVPILIGSVVVVAAGATAAIMIIRKRKS